MVFPTKVTVIVPTLDAAATIDEQLEALSAQTYDGDWEVVISDNGSSDATLEIVRRWAPRLPGLRVVDSSAQRGVAFARNFAAEGAGDAFAICDADDVVAPAWLARLVEALEDADLVGGSLEHETLNDDDSAAWRGGAVAALPRPCNFLPFAVGCNLAMRRPVWEAVGGFSTDYRRGCEDVDFSWRAQLAGFKLAFVPEAIVHYRHRAGYLGSARQVYAYAREEARLVIEFRKFGASPRRLGEVGRTYLFVLTRLPFLVSSRRRRGAWIHVAAATLGRLSGSIRYQVFAL